MIDETELRITADLAKITLKEGEFAGFAAEAVRMLGYFETMRGFDVAGLEPTTHALIAGNVTRTDEPLRDGAPEGQRLCDAILDQAPDLEGRLIVIPNVL